jgi:hypothetical protein
MQNTNSIIIASLIFVAGVLLFVSAIEKTTLFPLSGVKVTAEKKRAVAPVKRIGKERVAKASERRWDRTEQRTSVKRPSRKTGKDEGFFESIRAGAGRAYKSMKSVAASFLKMVTPEQKRIDAVKKGIMEFPYGDYFDRSITLSKDIALHTYTFVRNLAAVTYVVGKKIAGAIHFD